MSQLIGLFTRLKNFFFKPATAQDKVDRAAGREVPRPEDTTKPVQFFLDAEALSAKFRAAETGQDDGARNYPGPNADTFGDFETKIINQCDSALSMVRTETISQLKRLEANLAATDINSIESKLDMDRENHIREMRSIADIERENLISKKTEQFAALRDLRHFQRRHKRVSWPKPSREDWLETLVIFIIVEAALNCGFFMEVYDGGLALGFMVALAVAFVNLSGSFWLASGWGKWTRHIDRGRRVFGRFVLVAYGVVLLFSHYVIGNYRYGFHMVTDDKVEPSAVNDFVVQNLSNPWVALTDLPSLILVLLGITLGLGAAFWGRNVASDRYPGYSEKGDTYTEATQNFRDAWGEVRKKIQGQVDELRKKYDEAIKDQDAKWGLFFRLTRDYETAVAYYDENRAQIQGACAAVLNTYWQENQAVRTARAPAHFGKEAALRIEFPEEILDAAERREAYAIIVDTDKRKAEEYIGKVHQAAQKVLDELDTLLDEIENIADDRSKAIIENVFPGGFVSDISAFREKAKTKAA